jgi:hypothetical protein
LHGVRHALDVGGQQRVEVVLGDVGPSRDPGGAGVGHDHVEALARGVNLGVEPIEIGRCSDVARHGYRV